MSTVGIGGGGVDVQLLGPARRPGDPGAASRSCRRRSPASASAFSVRPATPSGMRPGVRQQGYGKLKMKCWMEGIAN